MVHRVRALIDRLGEDGQGLVEYGLILALVTLLGIGVLGSLGGTTNNFIGRVGDSLTTVS
jgi:Flp pilus assembly pilin Flp